jgi:hypothetical protein
MSKHVLIEKYNTKLRRLILISLFLNIILVIVFVMLGPLDYGIDFQKRPPQNQDFNLMIHVNLGVYAATALAHIVTLIASSKSGVHPEDMVITFAMYSLKVPISIGYYYYYSIEDSKYDIKKDYIGLTVLLCSLILWFIYIYLTVHSYNLGKKLKADIDSLKEAHINIGLKNIMENKIGKALIDVPAEDYEYMKYKNKTGDELYTTLNSAPIFTKIYDEMSYKQNKIPKELVNTLYRDWKKRAKSSTQGSDLKRNIETESGRDLRKFKTTIDFFNAVETSINGKNSGICITNGFRNSDLFYFFANYLSSPSSLYLREGRDGECPPPPREIGNERLKSSGYLNSNILFFVYGLRKIFKRKDSVISYFPRGVLDQSDKNKILAFDNYLRTGNKTD